MKARSLTNPTLSSRIDRLRYPDDSTRQMCHRGKTGLPEKAAD